MKEKLYKTARVRKTGEYVGLLNYDETTYYFTVRFINGDVKLLHQLDLYGFVL